MKSTSSKSKKQSKGLGDTIEKITEATGIKKLVKFVAGEDCGCEERKALLNDLFPYKEPECLEEDEYNQLTEFFETFDNGTIKEKYTKPIATIHARVFNHKMYMPCTCNPKEWKQWTRDLRKVYEQYKTE